MEQDPRAELVRMGRLLFERMLADTTGGNISLREHDRVFMSPAFSGSRQQWQLEPEDVVVLDLAGRRLEGPDRQSRETRIHLGIYNRFPRAGGVIHAQCGHYMAFVLAGQPIPPALELAGRLGTIGVAAAARAHSGELARNVVEALEPHEAELEKHGIATLMPGHGCVVVGADLPEAFETLERIENNARAILLRNLLEAGKEPGQGRAHG